MIQKSKPRNPLSPTSSQQTGKLGEDLAIKFLAEKGFLLIDRNYHIRAGEIDIIMENNDIMLFVEVKTRTSTDFGEPEDALTALKSKKILRAILHYLSDHPTKKIWRCDLAAIKFTSKNKAQIKHFKNILDT